MPTLLYEKEEKFRHVIFLHPTKKRERDSEMDAEELSQGNLQKYFQHTFHIIT